MGKTGVMLLARRGGHLGRTQPDPGRAGQGRSDRDLHTTATDPVETEIIVTYLSGELRSAHRRRLAHPADAAVRRRPRR
jgi:hypothetical protein